ncbi:pyruvate, phosphate dikinase [Mycobacterium talmoniae]|uniref:Pyruvate, phosphate dikinase n=1 Tax=Mycobacterium talmoniae TaxID=1858794 RepID=A0A1S1NPF8_9MYCO|nr:MULTISPECIES: pyruvate, phosphate dikinase [Mycobacterium]OHV05236.1 pyruvate, phosphate dikinase [Mycobacterium talmoniae]PQM45376.1 Pyruvate, phosphate dikinase [Mycobacterium talmoniae]TDH48331.1 pyruvate, phosphate dikinase [Mycobacterium eburneum]
MTSEALDPAPLLTLDGSTPAGRELLGGKAWSIHRMMALGIPVPPAFVITTEVCRRYYAADETLPEDVWQRVPDAIAELESATGRRFGGSASPLLVSVRSGAATSMPGMMDTILNLGVTADVERAIAEESGDAAYAADTRRRFLEQFEKVVGCPAPSDPWEQLRLAVVAVLESWNSKRAKSYRARRGLSHDGGTAVTVQAMVFGNLDDRSGTGVLFSRDPLTGAAEAYGEWLPRGQGEDVVSGRADALPLDRLAATMPEVHAELMEATARLESDSRDVQDIEFTVESGTLWLLQARDAKRSPQAAVRHAVLLQREGIITTVEALDRVNPDHVRALLAPHLDPTAVRSATPIAAGKPACPGVATGVVVTNADEAEERADGGEAVILARPTTDPDDVAAMSVAAAVLTELGGSTSHAAVVCREMAVPCVVGCGTGNLMALAGRTVTVDATAGTIFPGEVRVLAATVADDLDLALLTAWAREEQGPAAQGSLPELLQRRNEAARR